MLVDKEEGIRHHILFCLCSCTFFYALYCVIFCLLIYLPEAISYWFEILFTFFFWFFFNFSFCMVLMFVICRFVMNALKAKEFYRRDVQYIVKNGQALIINEVGAKFARSGFCGHD